ncbi:hypothetical protein E2C01_086698 [Portunus trituberculatus]|uniref:Uncharacterized protein n=1 Tax=Portunus trituberculatus TaxID=210409 RepID=A0A5B7JC55_PORTR|nr:hypothetical protein [Portunus trituberculatus]
MSQRSASLDLLGGYIGVEVEEEEEEEEEREEGERRGIRWRRRRDEEGVFNVTDTRES